MIAFAPYGKVRKVEPGEILFRPDDTGSPFFVVLSGRMEIVQPDLAGERPVAAHGPGEFTGEITMISGQRSLVLGRVTEAGEFLEISADALRTIIAKDERAERDFHAGVHPAAAGSYQ